MNAAHFVVVALALAAVDAPPQVTRPVPTITAVAPTAATVAGSTVEVTVNVVLPEGLHVQSDKPRDPALIPTALTIQPPAGVSVRRIVYPKAKDLRQAGASAPLAVFSGTFDIDVQLSVARGVKTGPLRIPGELRYQSCTEQVCFPPSRAPVTWTIRVKPR